MQRSTAALLGLGFLAALVGVILISHESPKKPERPVAAVAKPSASAPPAVSAAAPSLDAGAADEDAGELGFGAAFETFPDGGRVPELPNSAPQEVSFGVIQFAYQGAQFSTPDTRTKQQAKQKATDLLELAKHDFVAAVAKGDRGSTSDAGRIPRGVLEPPVEFILFMLDKGAVSPTVIDTPRGIWILRRND